MGSDLIESATVSKSKSSSSAGKFFPPGFRFHPTDEELVLYYLKRKICRRPLKLDIIGEVDVYKWDPDELPGQSKWKTGDRQWFFFSPRDRKYPNGGRSSRATMNGYWKATGKDRTIKRKSCSVGNKKTLVYYQGRAPTGSRTDWVMHEYTLDEEELKRCPLAQEHYVLSKIFKKSGPGPKNGEQYGAPFVEEEWGDDDCLDIDALLVQKVDPIPVNDLKNVQEEEENVFSSDMVEFLKKIVVEPEILPPLPQILEESETLLVESSSSRIQKAVDEDFLEMDDLIGPEPLIHGSEILGLEGLPFSGFDSLSEFDFYHDSTSMFGTQQLELQGAFMGNLEFGTENSGLGSEVVNHNRDEFSISYDLWDHDRGDSSITTTHTNTAHLAISQPPSGVIIEENPEFYINQENPDNGSDSWISSALWAFVDSIPTTPASASEGNALVNKAFERMSSFSRGRNINLSSSLKRLDNPKPSRSSRRGIVFYSVLGVLFAILWVFVGSSIEFLGRCIWW